MSRTSLPAAAACAALFALCAVSAPAFAAAGEFTIGTAPAAITGSQVAVTVFEFTNSSGSFTKFKCSVAIFEGTSSVASGTDLTITPEFGGCTFGGLAASVQMNGCKYTFTGSAALTASVDIAQCTTGKKMEIKKGNCTITIPEQNNLAHVTVASNGSVSEMDTLVTVTIAGINNTQTGSECFAPGLTSSDASYSGTVTFKAFNDSGSRNVSKHEHSYQEVICGTQVSLTVD
jgi:hypothetical protein